MSTNFQQSTPEELRPEVVRLPHVRYSVVKIQEAIKTAHPEILSYIAGSQIVREELIVSKINIPTSTSNQKSEINLDLVSSDVSLVGFEQHKRRLAAEQEVADSFTSSEAA